MLKIRKILNNNMVSAWGKGGKEIIVKGKGVGYQKKSGDLVEQEKVEKIFSLSDPKEQSLFMQLIEKIPYEHILIADRIISYARQSLNKELNEHIYIAVSDHISYAIERYQQGINFKNPLLWEIKRFYPHEYDIGVEAVRMINEDLKVMLPEDEAGLIALHIIDAELNIDMDQTMRMTEIMQDILNIIKYYFQVTFDEKQLAYNRLTTHLKYFVQRVSQETVSEGLDADFVAFITDKYPEAYQCTNRIAKYVENKIHQVLSEEEKLYLTVHIHRVIENFNERG